MRKGSGRALLLAAAAALACGESEPERSTTGPAGPAAPPGAAAPAAALALPSEGEVEVSFGSEGILALANQAPRRRVLEAIARETGLVTLVFLEGADPEGPVTIQSRGEPIEVVLVRALSGVPFSLEPIERGPGQQLALVVGQRVAAEAPRGRRPAAMAEAPERAQRSPEAEAEALEQLASRDPEQRAEGVEWVDVTSPAGFAAVVERLANDPDATVRSAAAESLGDADVGAVPPLIQALGDPDARVVLAALESLELLGDASTAAELGPALEHPDAAVRERAAEVVEFLE